MTKKRKTKEDIESERKERQERIFEAVVSRCSEQGRAAYKFFLQNIEEVVPAYYEWPPGSQYVGQHDAETQMIKLFELAKKGLENDPDRWIRRVKDLEGRLEKIRRVSEGK